MAAHTPSEPRDTHVTHTPTSGIEIHRLERELLRKKILAFLQGKYTENRTAWLSMRVTPTLRELYSRAPSHIRLAARRAFESVLISWFLGGESVEWQRPGQPMVFNVNININENQARAETRVELPDKIRKELKMLEELLEFIAFKSVYPASIKARAREGLDTLRELYKKLSTSN